MLLVSAALAVLIVLWIVCRMAGKSDRMGGLLLPAALGELASAFILLSFGFEDVVGVEGSSQLIPLLWGVSLLVCCVAQFVRVWRAENVKPVNAGRLDKVLIILLIASGAVIGMDKFGFFACTGLMIILMSLTLGEKRVFTVVTIAVAWIIFTYIIFNKLLLLGLPVGDFFERFIQ